MTTIFSRSPLAVRSALLLWVVVDASRALAESSADEWLTEPECYFASNFVQNRAFPDGVNYLTTSGQFYFDCEHGFIWKIEAPILNSQVILGSGGIYDLGNSGAVRRPKNHLQNQIGSLLSSLLSGDREEIQKDFAVTAVGPELHLEPRRMPLQRFLHRIVIRRLNAQSRQVIVEQSDEQVLTIAFSAKRAFSPNVAARQRCIDALGETGQESCQILLSSLDELSADLGSE